MKYSVLPKYTLSGSPQVKPFNPESVLPKENRVHQSPLMLNPWVKQTSKKAARSPCLSKTEMFELMAKMMSPREYHMAQQLLDYHFEHEALGLTDGQKDNMRLSNALLQLSDIAEFRVLQKAERLPFGSTLTELAKRAYEHYFNRTEFVSVFFKHRLKIRQALIPSQHQPLRPYDRAILNVHLSRVLMKVS